MTLLDNNNSLGGQGTSGSTDIVTQLQGIVLQLSALVQATQALSGAPTFGSFTLDAAATTVVVDSNVESNSLVVFSPTNADAGTLMGGTQALYLVSIAGGASFTVGTADGTSAGGNETFSYVIYTPS